MRPVRPTAVHKTDRLAELVCSNSFRGDKLDNAVGLLKEEMRRLGSLVMRAAEESRVPAGAALAVDRERFAQTMTDAVASHPRITVSREEVAAIPDASQEAPVIVATGPLTSDALSADIARPLGPAGVFLRRHQSYRPRLRRSIARRCFVNRDGTEVWCGGEGGVRARCPVRGAGRRDLRRCGVDDGQGDYLNCTTRDDTRIHDALFTPNPRPFTTSTRKSSLRGVCQSKSWRIVVWIRYASVR
jgi:hypothetical protein